MTIAAGPSRSSERRKQIFRHRFADARPVPVQRGQRVTDVQPALDRPRLGLARLLSMPLVRTVVVVHQGHHIGFGHLSNRINLLMDPPLQRLILGNTTFMGSCNKYNHTRLFEISSTRPTPMLEYAINAFSRNGNISLSHHPKLLWSGWSGPSCYTYIPNRLFFSLLHCQIGCGCFSYQYSPHCNLCCSLECSLGHFSDGASDLEVETVSCTGRSP